MSQFYVIIKSVAALAMIAGVLLLLSHLMSQIRIGWGSSETLVGGLVGLLGGLLFLILADIGGRLSARSDASPSGSLTGSNGGEAQGK